MEIGASLKRNHRFKPGGREAGLDQYNSTSLQAFARTSQPLRPKKSEGFSNQNNHQVVEHHLVKGQHVAALGYGTLGGDQLKTNELLARA